MNGDAVKELMMHGWRLIVGWSEKDNAFRFWLTNLYDAGYGREVLDRDFNDGLTAIFQGLTLEDLKDGRDNRAS